ncbi:FAD/NAD(P)-binding protein [Pseudomonas sp. SWRI99]|uniref:FAD/NAD(P)-binding protein n=1 Tax=Pseudomonas sp. SWRI99 TaxID=2745506 RepID=UPI001647CB46|nr:FAD/NAD(P)-binding protein [Pseudomonas sp. SWRI99]MBC3775840.1 FAD/NAD(P)-binding protein [Pseudomonas sp. SWRI99]
MKTVVIVGAGFSGTVLAAHLLTHHTNDVRVILINRSGPMGRGLAYGTNSAVHLLNVPAGNMSAYVAQPDHFLNYCNSKSLNITGSSFVPRQVYGEYLSDILKQAADKSGDGMSFQQISCEVLGIRYQGNHFEISIKDGTRLYAEHAVLALGNFSPVVPHELKALLGTAYYIQDPWSSQIDQKPLEPNESVLLIGTGLTALDTATRLLQQGHSGSIYMVSRRGLLPLPHRKGNRQAALDYPIEEELFQNQPSVLNYSRILRSIIKRTDCDWRDVIAAIRPITDKLWLRLNQCERRRFLRHLQPYWDIHRHRVAPDSFDIFKASCANRQIKTFAGRIQSFSISNNHLSVIIKPRSSESMIEIEVGRIINCTGPNTNLELANEPLIDQLLDSKLALQDEQKLGLLVNDDLTLANELSEGDASLSYIGPMLKAKYWEATAVPELRKYAAELAASIAHRLKN